MEFGADYDDIISGMKRGKEVVKRNHEPVGVGVEVGELGGGVGGSHGLGEGGLSGGRHGEESINRRGKRNESEGKEKEAQEGEHDAESRRCDGSIDGRVDPDSMGVRRAAREELGEEELEEEEIGEQDADGKPNHMVTRDGDKAEWRFHTQIRLG